MVVTGPSSRLPPHRNPTYPCHRRLRSARFIYPAYQSPTPNPQSLIQNLKSLDYAALTLLALGLLSTLASANFGVRMQAWRELLLGPVVFYFLVRLGRDYGPGVASPRRWVWRLLDALVAGAVCHAGLVLYGYFFTHTYIAAEGVRRVMSPFYAHPII